MFDPEFDPLTELRQNQQNLLECVRAINNLSVIIKQQNSMITALQLQISQIEMRLNQIEAKNTIINTDLNVR